LTEEQTDHIVTQAETRAEAAEEAAEVEKKKRRAEEREAKATKAAEEAEKAAAPVATAEQATADDDMPKLGVALAKLTDEDRASMGLADDLEGAMVTEVTPGSPAAQKGLQRGDVIVQADRKQVSEPKMVIDAVREAAERGDATILLLVKREGQDRFVAVRLERV
jgi:serine protease Do